MPKLKRQAKPSRSNAYIDMIEEITNATAEEVTVSKQQSNRFDTCYEVAVKNEVVGYVFGSVGSNYRPQGPRLQVRLNDSVKWFTQRVDQDDARKTSSRSRIEAIYSLVNDFYS